MYLSKYGNIIDNRIKSIDNTYNHISIDKYVIMPNHIHLIIVVSGTSRTPSPTGSNRINLQAEKLELDKDFVCETVCATTHPSPTNSTIPFVVSTLKRLTNREIGFNVWQRSFHDHIIRNKKDYQKIWEYIDTNLLKWKDDCFYIDEII